MKPHVPILCAALATLAGCRHESKPVVSAPPHPSSTTTVTVPDSGSAALSATAPQSARGAVAGPPSAPASLPPNVVAQVNGRALTMADVVSEVELVFGTSKAKGLPDQNDKVRQAAVKTVVERFVANTLLLAEADRLGITLTPEDETNAVASLQAMLPPGVTADQAMRQSPVGEARFREEMLATARIKKMLRTASIPETSISDADYIAFTNQFRTEIDKSEAVRARHILVATKPTDDAAEKARKHELADSVRTQLLAGADFATLAKTHSDCPSKDKGGDLGRFGRRKMVKPFSDAAFSQPVNAIGDVVETQFGYHVIQVTERKAVGKDELLDILRRRRLLERLAKTADIRFNQSLEPRGDRREAPVTSAPLGTPQAPTPPVQGSTAPTP